MTEKRACRRLTIELPSHYFPTDDETKSENITLVNISSGGLCFISKTKLGVRKHVHIRVPIGDNNFVTLKTVIMWYRKNQDIPQNYLNGVKILDQKSADAKNFIRFCEHNLLYPPDEY